MGKRLIVALPLFLCCLTSAQASSLKSVAKELAKGLAAFPNKRVAVLSFPYHDGSSSSGSSIVSERLTMLLVQRKGVEVVERTLLDHLMSEIKLESSGAVDSATTQKLGKVLGVDAIVTGTLIDLEGSETEVNARLIRTATGEILAAATTRVDRTWKDLPHFPPVAETVSKPVRNDEDEDNSSHLHMSRLIYTPSARNVMPPPLYMVPAGTNAPLTASSKGGRAEVLTLTNDDLAALPHLAREQPNRFIDETLEDPHPAPQNLPVVRRIYHRNPDERTRGRALLAMGHVLEGEGRPGAVYAYRQVVREFPNQPDLQKEARAHLIHP